MKKETMLKVHFWLSIILFLVIAALLLSAYKNWFFVSPLLTFNLGILAIGLYAVHMVVKEGNKLKEVFLLFTLSLCATLFISTLLHDIWVYENILTKLELTRITIILLLILGIYLTIAYIRARITYKQVKGNQRHSEAWHVSKKDLKKMEQSKDIYINLGIYHEAKED